LSANSINFANFFLCCFLGNYNNYDNKFNGGGRGGYNKRNDFQRNGDQPSGGFGYRPRQDFGGNNDGGNDFGNRGYRSVSWRDFHELKHI